MFRIITMRTNYPIPINKHQQIYVCYRGTIDQFKRSIQSNRYGRGEVVLSFFDRREIKEWIGLVTRTENVYFERWHIPVVVLPGNSEGEDSYRSAYDQVTKCIISVLEVRSKFWCCYMI
jgi:hypothetical protein